MTEVLRGRVVTPAGVVDDGLVRITDGRISEVGPAGPRAPPAPPGSCPGSSTSTCTAAAGTRSPPATRTQASAASRSTGRHGTTTMLASLVTAPPELIRRGDRRARAAGRTTASWPASTSKGPTSRPARCGAQNPAYLRDPDPDEIAELLTLGGVRMVTVAPELPGALAAIRLLAARGVVAAIGHTDATYEQTRAAIDEGAQRGDPPVQRACARCTTASRARSWRCSTPPRWCASRSPTGCTCTTACCATWRTPAGPDRVALVTDAMAAAGMPDGEYDLGGLVVRVAARGGPARPGRHDRRQHAHHGRRPTAMRSTVDSPSWTRPRMAATTPARVLGLDGELGAVAAGPPGRPGAAGRGTARDGRCCATA